MTKEEVYSEIYDSLSTNYNADELLAIYQEANAYNGSFSFSNLWELDEMIYCFNPRTVVYGIINGNVDNTSDLVRIDDYGCIKSVSKERILDECRENLDELVQFMLNTPYSWRLDDERFLCSENELLDEYYAAVEAGSVETE